MECPTLGAWNLGWLGKVPCTPVSWLRGSHPLQGALQNQTVRTVAAITMDWRLNHFCWFFQVFISSPDSHGTLQKDIMRKVGLKEINVKFLTHLSWWVKRHVVYMWFKCCPIASLWPDVNSYETRIFKSLLGQQHRVDLFTAKIMETIYCYEHFITLAPWDSNPKETW